MYSFSRIEGWYDGRPVAAGSTPSKLISARSISSTNTLITRTGLSSSMKSSRHSGNSVHCPRSTSSMKRLINPPKNHGRIITAAQRFHTARVTNVQFHRGRASNLFRSDPKSGHSVVHVRSAALCQMQTRRRCGTSRQTGRMPMTDEHRTLEELEGYDSGDPETAPTAMVARCIRLQKIPLHELNESDLRLLIGQRIGLKYLV